MRVPVEVYSGFPGAGKTTYIRRRLKNGVPDGGLLVILTEQGEARLEEKDMPQNSTIKTIHEHTALNFFTLSDWNDELHPQRVIVEMNGNWPMKFLRDNLPDGWFLEQEIVLGDGRVYPQYDQYARSYVTDKLMGCTRVVLNRCGKDMEKAALHKTVRAINRNCEIVYEYEDGRLEIDDLPDILPYDITRDTIVLRDADYAVWHRDFTEAPEKYQDKVIVLHGMVNTEFRVNQYDFIIGRMVMTCNIEDLSYKAVVCRCGEELRLINNQWIRLTARMTKEYHKIYMGEGPVLVFQSFEPAMPPKVEVATYS